MFMELGGNLLAISIVLHNRERKADVLLELDKIIIITHENSTHHASDL